MRHSNNARRSANGKFKAGFERKALPTTPREAGFAFRDHATPEDAIFPTELLRHFSLLLIPYVTAIGSALHSTYSAGDGSAAIFRSMPPNSHRVRGSESKTKNHFVINL